MANESLKAQFAALHAQRERDWAPEQLQKNVEMRAALVRKYDNSVHAQPGDVIADFTLTDSAGRRLTRDDLIRNGPAILIFFRFGGCPACNIALPHYDRNLSPVLKAAGIPIVAISPQVPVDTALRSRHGLDLLVASDPGNILGNRLGITFEPDEKPVVKPGDSWIGSIAGTNSWALPQPTIIILDRDASIRFIDVSPDWLDRTEVDVIIEALPELRTAAAA